MKELEAIKTFQEFCKQQAIACSDLVYSMQVHDRTMMGETIKTLYHLNWSYIDLAVALEEITGANGTIYYKPGLLAVSRQEPMKVDDIAKSLKELYDRTIQAHKDMQDLVKNLVQLGVHLRVVPHFIGRLSLDAMFLEHDLKALGLAK